MTAVIAAMVSVGAVMSGLACHCRTNAPVELAAKPHDVLRLATLPEALAARSGPAAVTPAS
jgi:hypothetical protein